MIEVTDESSELSYLLNAANICDKLIKLDNNVQITE